MSYQYKIGDKIVYPMHGAGIIKSIKKENILGEERIYYIVEIPVGNGMKVMIPTANVNSVGLRPVISSNDVTRVFEGLNKIDIMSDNESRWNKRQRDNIEKIRGGRFEDVVAVFMSLVVRGRKRDLSTGERKLLGSTKNIILSELILSNGLSQIDAEVYLNKYVELLANEEQGCEA